LAGDESAVLAGEKGDCRRDLLGHRCCQRGCPGRHLGLARMAPIWSATPYWRT